MQGSWRHWGKHMSKIARIRILNLNYNNNTIKIDDEMFDFNGQNTLISLRNGGGKSVLVQMIVSLFVNRSYRDFGDRPFKSYFTTNRPTFIMTEWILDNKADRFLAGMMVRKSQREDNDAEELEMYTFTGNYSKACSYDIENLPVIRQEGSKKILRGFSECKNLLEEISKSESRNFRLYDMTSSYGRGQYFNKLREYQVNNKEWESIIRKVNQKESGLSELFQNAKDEKNLVENWFLRPIEDKLNQEKNKTDEFRKLAFQFIEQYKSNQSKIQRKGIIEQYFEDTKPLKVQIDDYVQKDHDAAALRTEMILYVKALQRELKRLETEIAAGQEKIDQIKREQRRIVYEKLSYGIYIDEDRKTALLAKRTQQETAITELTYRKNQLTREIDQYDLHKLYQELKDFERQKAEVDAKLQVLLQKTEESKDEIGKIGSQLYALYSGKAEKLEKQKKREEENRVETEDTKKEVEKEFGENEQKIRKLGVDIGALTSRVKSFDEVEDTFNREFSADLRRNIVGLYVDGALEIFRKEMEAGLQEKKNESAKYAGKLLEQEQTQKRLSREIVDGNLKANDLAHQLDSLSKKLLDLEKQKPEIREYPDRLAILSHGESVKRKSRIKEQNVSADFSKGKSYDMLLSDVLEELGQENFWSMGPSICVKAKGDILSGRFDRPRAAGNMLVGESQSNKAKKVPGGSYACLYHGGSLEHMEESYQRLLKYVEANNLEITGDIYEIFLVDTIDTKINEELVTHIQIPVKRRTL